MFSVGCTHASMWLSFCDNFMANVELEVNEELRSSTKARESVKQVYWDQVNGRFRVTFKNPGMKQKWFPVKRFRLLVKEGARSLEDICRALTCTLAEGMEHCSMVS